MSSTKPLIVNLAADERRAMRELSFTARCKNTGKVHVYDFGARPQYEHLRAITEVFVWAMYKRRHHVGQSTMSSTRDIYWKFLRFLDEIGVRDPSQLRSETLSRFAQWLKSQNGLTYSSAASQYRTLAPVFIQMSKYESVSSDFRPVHNAFPKSTSLQTPNSGYDQAELKSIVRAAVQGMREAMAKYNAGYVPRWLNKPAPLDDVAPKTAKGGHSLWASMEYRIWWWENRCHCKLLNSVQLSEIPQGQVFISSFVTSGKTGMAGVKEFYNAVGAGDNYVPKYLGKDCPIKYRTPWKKLDYLVWYWENKVGCAVLSHREMREIAPELYFALKENFDGKTKWFYESLGVYRWIGGSDLVPFYLMLLVRTQLNPSTVQRLTVDCLVPDPTNPARKHFSYVKYRSSKKGQTIPSSEIQEGWPVALVNKVLKITESFRLPEQKELWIANANCFKETLPMGNSGMKRGLQLFSKKYDLRHTSGEPLSIQAKLIRPTMAWQEYLRTEDMGYLQILLGHERLGTTADYLRRISDPVLKMRRAVHQEAMFLGLTGASDDDASNDQIIATDGLLNHCKNPLHSPIIGQLEGCFCSASHEVCLGCPNLVITLVDIKKYFCFVIYHEQLMEAGMITEDEYRKATIEKRFMWENHILPRYSPEVIKSVRSDAGLNPIGIWSPTAEGAWL